MPSLKGLPKHAEMARAYDELATMSEPELRDIGINRGDIPAVISRTHRAPHSTFDPASSARQEKVAIAGP